jgi:plastocyanin
MLDQMEPTDEIEHTDATVDELVAEQAKEKVWHEWIGIAVGITGLLSVVAILLPIVALSSSSSGTSAQATPGASASAAASGASAVPVSKPQAVKLMVKADDEHGRRGPDGKWHDAFLPANFTVHPGDTVTVTVDNYDSGPHTFTSPSLGVNETIPGGGSLSAPHQVTFKFTAPKKLGKYQWYCALPCDPWAMAHNGYMRGFVTVAD